MYQEVKITKTQVECYKLRKQNGSFADITLDYKENQGRISISSDYGSWSNYWGACGRDFKEFLIGLDKYYASNKFGEDKFFDLERTIKGLEENAENYSESKERLSNLKDEIKELAKASSKEEFMGIMWRSERVLHMENNCPDICCTISPSFDNFWNNLWALFVAELKREKELEIV